MKSKMKFILTLFIFLGISEVTMSWSDSDGIFDVIPSRDLFAIKSMIEDDFEALFGPKEEGVTRDHPLIRLCELLDTMSGKFLVHSYFLDIFNYLFDDNRYSMKVLRIDNKTVGFMWYGINKLGVAYPFEWCLQTLIIDKNYRNKGYATKMLEYCINDIEVYGADKIIVFCNQSNQNAQKFYIKNGFYIKNSLFDQVLLVKPLINEGFDVFDAVKAVRKLKAVIKIFRIDQQSQNLNLKSGDESLEQYFSNWIDQQVEKIDNDFENEYFGFGEGIDYLSLREYYDSIGMSDSMNLSIYNQQKLDNSDIYKIEQKAKLKAMKAVTN